MNQFPQAGPSHPRRNAKFLYGGSLLAVAVAGLLVWGMTREGAASFYVTTSELLAKPPAPTTDYRVNGRVVPGSIERDGLVTTFDVSDGTTDVTVTTDRPLPDTFRERSDVVARGSWDGRVFTAAEVLAKCPSKFKVKA